MDVRIDYEPLEWQRAVHESHSPHLALVGGLGCVRESSLILTSRGQVPIAGLAPGSLVWSWTDKGFRLVPSSGGFPKGKENLYRVNHAQGEFVAASHHLVFCADYKYRRVDELLFYTQCSKILSATSEGSFQKGLPLDDHHWIQKLLSFLDNCEADTRQCGLLLQSLRAYALTGFRSHACARGNDQLCDQFQELLHSRLVLSPDLRSMMDYILRSEAPVWDEVSRNVSKSCEHISSVNQGSHQSPLLYVLRQIIQRSLDAWDFSCTLTSHESTIQSIERIHKTEWYWDMQVPNTNNYISGGAIHHNSGKSTAAIRELEALAIENPGFTYLIGRKHMPSLRDTAMKSFFSLVSPDLIKDYNKTHSDVTFINNSKIIFRGLDDLEKLKSLEIGGFFINEANEVDLDLYNTLKSRVRERVGGKNPTRYRTIIDLNPTDETHWIPQLFMHRKPAGHQIFFSSTMQNTKNLPVGYVEELLQTYTPDMVQRMVYGLFGKVHKGAPVFSQFARDPNYYKRRLEPDPRAPIFVGMDFGFNHPSWVWLQFIDGQARVLAEKLGHKIYLEEFIPECEAYAKSLWGEWRPGYKYFCDPRGSDESDKGKSSLDICQEFGIRPMYRRTFIEEGIRAIKSLMDTKTGSDSNFLIHHRCAILIDALSGGYHRLDGEDSPEKDGYYDQLMDSLRYACVHLTKRYRFNKLQDQVNSNARVFIHPVSGRRVEY